MSLGKGPKVLGYKIEIQGAGAAKSDLGAVSNTLHDTEKAADKLSTTIGTTLGGVFKKAAIIAAPMVGLASVKKAFSEATEDAEEWAKVGTFLPAGTDAVLKFGAAIDAIENDTGIAGNRLKARLETALQSGIGDADASKLIEESAKTAAATMQEFEGVFDTTTSVMNTYGEKADQVSHIQTALWMGVKNGAESVSSLGVALEQVAPLANELDIRYEELIAANSVLAKSGISGVKGLMSMGNVIVTLTNATAEAQDEATKLGIVWSTEGLKSMGFSNWIEHLSGQLKIAEEAGIDVASSLTKMGLSGRELGVFGVLTKGADKYRSVLDDIMNKTDELPERWAERQNDIGFQSERLKTNTGEIWEAIGTGMINSMFEGAEGVGTASDQIRDSLDNAAVAGENLGRSLKGLVDFATSEDGLPMLVDALSTVATVLGAIATPFQFIFGEAIKSGNWIADNITVPVADAITDVASRVDGTVPEDTSESRATGAAWAQETKGMRESGTWAMEDRVFDQSGRWTSPEAAMMYGGIEGAREAHLGMKAGELALPPTSTPSAPQPAAPPPPTPDQGEKVKLTVEQLLKLQIDQKGKVKGASSSGKVSGSGAADAKGVDINAGYRFMVIGAGEGEHAVRPMPMNVIMGHVRPE
jgi:TP901 family phage tail tape measure protein